MIRFIFALLATGTMNFLFEQSVGIGTTAPNATAQLEVASTNKGFLVPRMTSTNRSFISNPANGLLVYDTTQNRMYLYQNGAWQYSINDSYWRTSTIRNWVYNTADSVGIGTSSPTNRLDVNGNIRSRDNIISDSNIVASAGVITGSILQSTSNIFVNGTSSFTGDVTTSGDVIVNSSTATLQLRNGSNVNTGFFQLSGNNVRLGTNSGNSAGNLIMRINGTDRVFIDETGNVGIDDASPNHKLEVNGNINLTGELIKSSLTGTASLTPYCYDSVFHTGSILHGTGNFSAQRLQTGIYRITCTGITNNNCVILVTSRLRSRLISTIKDTNSFDLVVTDLSDSETDTDFDFVVFKL